MINKTDAFTHQTSAYQNGDFQMKYTPMSSGHGERRRRQRRSTLLLRRAASHRRHAGVRAEEQRRRGVLHDVPGQLPRHARGRVDGERRRHERRDVTAARGTAQSRRHGETARDRQHARQVPQGMLLFRFHLVNGSSSHW